MAKKKDEKSEPLTEYILRSAETKKKTPGEWWETTVQNIGKCQLATHVGKFTHPDSQVALLVERGAPDAGYVTTQGSRCQLDVKRDASIAPSAEVLLRFFPDAEKLSGENKEGAELLEELNEHRYFTDQLIRNINSVIFTSIQMPAKTDGNLKQVYFPIRDDGQYHLLTVLPASSLLLELKSRLLQMAEQRRRHCDKKEEEYGRDWENIPNLTEVGFGGTNKQNISTLNSRAGGTGYLLPSLPPAFGQREVRRPKRDFFRETIPYREVERSLRILHALFQLDRNNKGIRMRIRGEVDALAELAAALAARLREEPAGWSEEEDFSALPSSQKIWLDEANREVRLDGGSWLDEVSTRFGRWLISRYERAASREKVILGDTELKFLRDRLAELLKEEVRMDK